MIRIYFIQLLQEKSSHCRDPLQLIGLLEGHWAHLTEILWVQKRSKPALLFLSPHSIPNNKSDVKLIPYILIYISMLLLVLVLISSRPNRQFRDGFPIIFLRQQQKIINNEGQSGHPIYTYDHTIWSSYEDRMTIGQLSAYHQLS